MDDLEEGPLRQKSDIQEDRTMSGWKTYLAGGIFIAIAAYKGLVEANWTAAVELFSIGLAIIGGRHALGKIEAKIGQ